MEKNSHLCKYADSVHTYKLTYLQYIHKCTNIIINIIVYIIVYLQSGVPHNPQLVYFAIEDEFEEVLEHIDRAEKRFSLHLTRYNCGIAQAS